jgi:flavorubredoxin
MNAARKLTADMYWVGENDRRLALFENIYPLPKGVSYNSFLVLDKKTILFDSVDESVENVFFDTLTEILSGRPLDYIVVQHVEPDHASSIANLLRQHPETTIITTALGSKFLEQFFGDTLKAKMQIVKENDTLTTGRHTYQFVMAPMVHWPEVMVTYDRTDKILYSADAFGTFGALSGNIFADECDFEHRYLEEARRYYTNIVGKYGFQVQNLLKKAAALDIKMICPLHGPLWHKNINWFLDKYQHWATYTPEDKGIVIAYGSIYGHTKQVAEILAGMLADKGVQDISVFDVSATHPSYIVAEAFRCSHIVLASVSYNNGIFDTMNTLVHDFITHDLKNRTMAVIENGSWAPVAGKLIREQLSTLKNITWIEPQITLKSAIHPEQESQLEQLAQNLVASIQK